MVDEPLQDLGEKLRTAAQQSGADAVLTVMSPRATDGSEPPAPVAEALAACDVFIAPASRSLSHTLARKRASEGGRPRRDDAPRHRRHARPADVDRLRPPPQPLARDRRPPRQGHRGPRDLPARDRPAARPPRPPGHRRRRRPHRAAARSATSRAARGSSRRPGGEGTMYARSIAAIGLTAGHPAKLTVENGHLDGGDRPRGRAAPGHPARARGRGHQPRRARGRHERSRDPHGQRPRGREDPRERPRRLRREHRVSAARSPCRSTSTASSPRRRSRSTARACWTRAASSSPPDATELPWSGEMAQTKRKRRTKHRGNAAGIVEVRGRTTRPASPEARKAQQKGDARKARMDRYAKPPSWRSAANRALVATILFVAVDHLRASSSPRRAPSPSAASCSCSTSRSATTPTRSSTTAASSRSPRSGRRRGK